MYTTEAFENIENTSLLLFFSTIVDSTILLPERRVFQYAIHHLDQCKMLNIQIKLELFFYE